MESEASGFQWQWATGRAAWGDNVEQDQTTSWQLRCTHVPISTAMVGMAVHHLKQQRIGIIWDTSLELLWNMDYFEVANPRSLKFTFSTMLCPQHNHNCRTLSSRQCNFKKHIHSLIASSHCHCDRHTAIWDGRASCIHQKNETLNISRSPSNGYLATPWRSCRNLVNTTGATANSHRSHHIGIVNWP